MTRGQSVNSKVIFIKRSFYRKRQQNKKHVMLTERNNSVYTKINKNNVFYCLKNHKPTYLILYQSTRLL